jgi:hypothetical protein
MLDFEFWMRKRKRGGEHRTSKGSVSFKVQVFSFKSEKEDLETEEVRKEAAFFFEPQSTIYDLRSTI